MPLPLHQHKAIREVGLPQTPPLFHSNTPVPRPPCKKENLYQNVQRCVFRIYIYETQNKKRKIFKIMY